MAMMHRGDGDYDEEVERDMMMRKKRGRAGGVEEEVRMFRLSVDVRSFKAGLRLPMKAINACVRVFLPPQIVKLALSTPNSANAAKLTAPIRTHPPVIIQKGSEVALSNGYVALELPASVSGLAATLSQDTCLQAQVFHRDKYAADSLIGTASIPMSSLMKETWLDGYAPVYSPLQLDGKVNIGMLRVVLSAEELGPVTPIIHKHIRDTSVNTKAISPTLSLEDPFQLLKKNFNEHLPSKVVGVQTELQDNFESKTKMRPYKERDERAHIVHGKSKTLKSMKGNQENLLQTHETGLDKTDQVLDADEKLRRCELEWEFERWRRVEEAKWKANLRDKEMKRIASLEAEWKEKERECLLDIDKTRTELSKLEAKFRAKIFALEKRERTLVMAEEEALMRREAWTRECNQRAADAEVAVKRLQSECEHRVELERVKYTALKEQHSVLEKRLTTANVALANLEKQFCAYKSEHCKTSEAELTGQVMLLKQQCNDLKRNCEKALRMKTDYKVQIQKMAKELAKLHRQRTQDEADRHANDRGHAALQSLIEAQTRKNEEEKKELRELKEQLQHLQIHEQEVPKRGVIATPAANTAVKQEESIDHSHCLPLHSHPISSHISSEAVQDEKNPNGGRKDLNKSIQVDRFRSDIGKQGFHVNGEGKEGFDDWLSAELSIEDMLDHKSIISGLDDGLKEDIDTCQIRASTLSDDIMHTHHSDLDNVEEMNGFNASFYGLQLSEFQNAEIRRLKKQRLDLLQTGVYTEEDRIIKGLDQEIHRLEIVDTKKFGF